MFFGNQFMEQASSRRPFLPAHQIVQFMNPRDFQCRLRCYSAPFFQKADAKKIQELNYGGKILLPNSVLDSLIRLNIQYPMMFKLTSLDPAFQRTTHAGVLEFLAEEGKAYLPSWMMEQLHLSEGMMCLIQYARLPNATYAKFKPTSTDFLTVTNPRAMLEVELRKFACLTKGDVLSVQYNDQVLQFQVMALKPGNAVTIIECDMNVEFDAPDGYVEPQAKPKVNEMPEAPAIAPTAPASGPFGGSGVRLDGKTTKPRTISTSSLGGLESTTPPPPAVETPADLPPVVPDESYQPGALDFVRYNYKNRSVLATALREKQRERPVPFGGNRVGGASTTNYVPFQGAAAQLRKR
ncbi:hypothetical protein M3Y99_01496200 [Aphelenchoides fujianensis]|nr:hypothetical protein M3Y99_01496200 [Aphelenchoides fujianensis]